MKCETALHRLELRDGEEEDEEEKGFTHSSCFVWACWKRWHPIAIREMTTPDQSPPVEQSSRFSLSDVYSLSHTKPLSDGCSVVDAVGSTVVRTVVVATVVARVVVGCVVASGSVVAVGSVVMGTDLGITAIYLKGEQTSCGWEARKKCVSSLVAAMAERSQDD